MNSIISARSLSLLAAFGLSLATVACGSHVTGGSNSGNTGGGSQGEGGGAPADECKQGESRSCTTAQGQVGYQTCNQVDTAWLWGTCEFSGSQSTPLVLSFNGNTKVDTIATTTAFDLTGTSSVVTDWPTASTPWLALDRDANGAIEGGSELFGSATVLASGERAANGFIALADLDDNHDGRIDAHDAMWSKLAIWGDADGDRKSGANELSSLASKRLVSIDLAYTSERTCDERGNCVIERGTFRYLDESGVERTGAVLDVHLRFH
jgi:hypothetical protein